MKRGIPLDADEAKRLNEVLSKWSMRAKSRVSLDGLLSRWENFVAEVERGYGSSIYDYANDLSVRDVLDDVLESLPAVTAAKIRPRVEPWDERFEQATRTVQRPVVKGDRHQPWHFRVPNILGDELRSDLENEGIQ